MVGYLRISYLMVFNLLFKSHHISHQSGSVEGILALFKTP